MKRRFNFTRIGVNSLSLRLILSSALVSIVLLASAALLLAGLFQAALERNFDARLRAVLDGLLANVEVGADGGPIMPGQLADTRFTLPLSGWYWQVEPPPGKGLPDLASESLLEQRLKLDTTLYASCEADGTISFYLNDANGVRLRAIEQAFKLPGSEDTFSFLVAGNFDELKQEIGAFRNTLFAILGALGLGLLAAVFFQVKFGLQPLRKMQGGLTAIREGNAERLEGEFPSEIQPVADELNLLIQSNSEIIERARTQVGNLAHALKTPLSVLTNEAGSRKSPLAAKVKGQVEVMRDQVSLYLDRARRAARAKGLGAVTPVKPVLEGLARTLQRIYRDKEIDIAINCEPGLKFRGEKQDFEEMAGNLCDNACIWAKARVKVSAGHLDKTSRDGRSWLVLCIDDDGPGVPAEKRKEVLKRGRRLDESKPGSGLGLSIVRETAAMYNGGLTLDDAPLGGFRIQLKLPAAS